MTKLELTKTAVKIVVGLGTSRVISGICRTHGAAETSFQAVSVSGSSIVLGMMVGDIAGKYTDAKIDQIADWYNANVKK